MNSRGDLNKARTTLLQRFGLNHAKVKLVKIALIGVLALLALGGGAWGINTYRVNASLWTMPVDTYTVVEIEPSPTRRQVIVSYSTHDAAYATRLRQSINNDPDASVAFGAEPGCSGRSPYPLNHVPPDGSQFTMTFRRGGRVIETVMGQTNDCTLAQVHCGAVVIWKLGVRPIPLPE
ncbi:MAG TPA: hypothetical protein VE338_08665 [Ktedonobacterales bacterium]|nr:hypothetical protein [Ktedonobacterales bacterium]